LLNARNFLFKISQILLLTFIKQLVHKRTNGCSASPATAGDYRVVFYYR